MLNPTLGNEKRWGQQAVLDDVCERVSVLRVGVGEPTLFCGLPGAVACQGLIFVRQLIPLQSENGLIIRLLCPSAPLRKDLAFQRVCGAGEH